MHMTREEAGHPGQGKAVPEDPQQGWGTGLLLAGLLAAARGAAAADPQAAQTQAPPDTDPPQSATDSGEILLAAAGERNNPTDVDDARTPGGSNILAQWPEPEHLFGEWGGLRTRLRGAGASDTPNHTAGMVDDLSGDIDTGLADARQAAMGFDFERLTMPGISGLTTHIIVINREGRSRYNDGATVIQGQEIYGMDFSVEARLVWLYGEENLLNNRLNLGFGRVAPGPGLNAPPLFCNFMTLTMCGHDRALPAGLGVGGWPMSLWGARLRYWPTQHTYVTVGGYQSQPFPTYPGQLYTQGGQTGWGWTAKGTTGTSIPVELAWLPRFGDEQLRGRYKIGFSWDTSRYPDTFFDINGLPPAITGQPGRLHDGRGQLWVTANQMLQRHGPNTNDGLFVLVTYARDEPETTLFRNFVWAGFHDRGFWTDRPNDEIGLGVTYYNVSAGLNATQRLEAQLREPFVGGARGLQDHAVALEANYSISPWRGVLLQPALEYFIRPGATDAVPNAFLVGVKVHVDF